MLTGLRTLDAALAPRDFQLIVHRANAFGAPYDLLGHRLLIVRADHASHDHTAFACFKSNIATFEIGVCFQLLDYMGFRDGMGFIHGVNRLPSLWVPEVLKWVGEQVTHRVISQ